MRHFNVKIAENTRSIFKIEEDLSIPHRAMLMLSEDANAVFLNGFKGCPPTMQHMAATRQKTINDELRKARPLPWVD